MDIRTSHKNAIKQIVDFKKMLESRLASADTFEAMDRLYEQDFIITFMGKECRIAFGATEYYAVLQMLEDILEEL